MRPSIMSDGAITSALARALHKDCRTRYFSGFIVQYIACLVNQTILTVRGIDPAAIGDDAQLRKFFEDTRAPRAEPSRRG